MKLAVLTRFLESYAPLNYQEDYDNAGLIVGQAEMEVTGVLVALDCTEDIVDEAIFLGYNVIVTHHPIVFKGIKKLNGKNYIERVVMKAIKNDIALYAIHTNLDHVHNGVSGEICKRLGLKNPRILRPKANLLKKLVTFCPNAQAMQVRAALFHAGAGQISDYSECSFNAEGYGTFKGNDHTNAFVGERNVLHQEPEVRMETIFLAQDERKIIVALLENHPYEEVAYDIYPLDNKLQQVGAGMVGWLEQGMDAPEFLSFLKDKMNVQVIRHTQALPKKIRRVAVCGGSGSFLLPDALAANADVFITGDFKYHEFFDADKKLMIADIGHFESEQFTSNLLVEIIQEKFPNFAIRLTEHNTNPINYFI
ncbi:dinuclear metal center YbgI/SA1388 family protein [Pedobacter sp. CAN_A7]|uniref:Nif3-like dinuclear metal center hexameric protein n=1 Tax=Pedobacter sp. CAN_A7 TaxID=2787722 RepID=UPI0018CB5AA3